MKATRSTNSTSQLVKAEFVGGSLEELELKFDEVVNSPSEQIDSSKERTIGEPGKSKHDLKSQRKRFSIVNKGQIIVSLGVWVCCIIGVSKADGLGTTHILSLLSTACFISAGYIGIRVIGKPTKFRILFYVGLCSSSFIFGIAMLVVNIQLLAKHSQENEILISEVVFDSVEVILASTGVIISRYLYASARIVPN